MTTSLAEIYGHKENLSKAIASSDSFEELLNTCGVVSTEKAILGFFDEVDAASGAGGDWRRDPDGDDGDAGVVI